LTVRALGWQRSGPGSHGAAGLQQLQKPDPPLLCAVAAHLGRALEQAFLRGRHAALAPDDTVLVAPPAGPLDDYFARVYARVRWVCAGVVARVC
jgi:hypothetical protein